MTDPYGQNGPTSIPPQGGMPPSPQNPYPPGQYPAQGQPSAPYGQVPADQSSAPYGQVPQGQPSAPYGQVPPGQQNPYGQASAGQGPYGQAPAPIPAEYTAPAGSGSTAKAVGGSILKTVVGRVIGLVIVLAIGFGGYLFYKFTGTPSIKTNDCVTVTGTKNDPNVKKAACSNADTTWVVLAVNATCDETESAFTETNRGTSTKLCLYYNLSQGDCIKAGQGSSISQKGACAAGSYKVTFTSTSTSDEKMCPTGSTASVPNVTRNRLICLTKVS